MTNIGTRYTEGEINEIVYDNEDRILEEIREYIVDNISFDSVGDLDYDSELFFETTDTKFLFNVETEEIYEQLERTKLGDYMEELANSGKLVSVYDLNLGGLASYIENELIAGDEEGGKIIESYRSGDITREEYQEEIEMMINDRYIEEYMNKARLTIEKVHTL